MGSVLKCTHIYSNVTHEPVLNRIFRCVVCEQQNSRDDLASRRPHTGGHWCRTCGSFPLALWHIQIQNWFRNSESFGHLLENVDWDRNMAMAVTDSVAKW